MHQGTTQDRLRSFSMHRNTRLGDQSKHFGHDFSSLHAGIGDRATAATSVLSEKISTTLSPPSCSDAQRPRSTAPSSTATMALAKYALTREKATVAERSRGGQVHEDLAI
jgi:hypothetical protein